MIGFGTRYCPRIGCLKGKTILASHQNPYLFVYGTLKRGHHAHRYLGGARFVGVGRTGPEWTLLSNGRFPALTRAPSGLGSDYCGVVGEVFEIAPWTQPGSPWEILDDYEGVSAGLYRREEITLSQFEKALDGDKYPGLVFASPFLVQTYIFTGNPTGFSLHGNCW